MAGCRFFYLNDSFGDFFSHRSRATCFGKPRDLNKGHGDDMYLLFVKRGACDGGLVCDESRKNAFACEFFRPSACFV